MTARELPARATPVHAAEIYLALRLQLAAQLEHEAPRKAAIILTAQMALETRRFASTMNWNFGGVKCSRTWRGCWQHFPTREHWTPAEYAEQLALCGPGCELVAIGPSKQPGKTIYMVKGRHPANKFRAFENFDDAIAHHVAFLLRRYRPAVDAALLGDPRAYAFALRRGGYFTAPAEDYADHVESLANEYARTMPADPAPEAPRSPEAVPVSIAASVPAPEPETPAMTLPSPAAPSQPAALPPIAAPMLPRIGEPAPLEELPWYVRILLWLGRLLLRRPMP